MATEREPVILEELALTAAFTLEQYKEHIKNNRYLDASECLGAVARITGQMHAIEDHPDSPFTMEGRKAVSERQ